MKHAGAAELLSMTERLLAALAIPVYVNDRADVAWAAGARGVHLGHEDIPAALVRPALPAPFRVGLSVGSAAEAQVALQAGVDYWSVGPLYRTATKPDAGVPLLPQGFAALARLAPAGMPVVGIGGITAENAGAVIGAGASGVAVISAIFGGRDVEQATRAIREAVDAALAAGVSRGSPPGAR